MKKSIKFIASLFTCALMLSAVSVNTVSVFSQSSDEQAIDVVSIDTSSLSEVVLQIRNNGFDGDFLDAPLSLTEDGDPIAIIDDALSEVSLQLAFIMDPSQNLTVPGNTGDSRWFEVASAASDLVGARMLSAQTDLLAAYGPTDESDGFGRLAGWLRDHQAVVNTLYQYEPTVAESQSSELILSDALLEALGEFGDAELGNDAAKAMIVFSDGSKLLQTDKVNDVIDLANELNIQINVVMLGADTPIARGNLDRLSNGTDGRFEVLDSISNIEPLWSMLQQKRTIREVTYRLGSANASGITVAIEASDGQSTDVTVSYPEFSIEAADIEILSPGDTEEITFDLTAEDSVEGLTMPVSVAATWPDGTAREFRQIDYLIDGESVAQTESISDGFTLSLGELDNGEHTLTIIAIDELGIESSSSTVNFLLDIERPESSQEPDVSQIESATNSPSSEDANANSDSDGATTVGATLIESVSGENSADEAENNAATVDTAASIDVDGVADKAIDDILNETQIEDEKVGTGMNLFGIQLPDTVEIFGVPFLINPVTLLIAAFPLIFALALLTYWLSQRSTTRTAYKHDYDFYDIGQVPTIENNVFFEDDGQLQVTQPQIGIIDIEDDVTEPVKVPSFYTTAPAYLTYVSGGSHLPKKLPVEGSEPIRIGRKKSFCELVLDDRRVSRLHSVVSQLNGEFYIRDEGSSGGTFVNRKKLGTVDNQKLEHNDIINFNEVEYRFEVTTESAGQGNPVPSTYAPPMENAGI